jgi:hypothetical protein
METTLVLRMRYWKGETGTNTGRQQCHSQPVATATLLFSTLSHLLLPALKMVAIYSTETSGPLRRAMHDNPEDILFKSNITR